MLVTGWWDIDDKHLTGILCIVRILLLPYLNGGITLQSGTRSVTSITKMACQLLASMFLLLMIHKKNGKLTTDQHACFSFALLHNLLQRLVLDIDKVETIITFEIKEINELLHHMLQGLSALA